MIVAGKFRIWRRIRVGILKRNGRGSSISITGLWDHVHHVPERNSDPARGNTEFPEQNSHVTRVALKLTTENLIIEQLIGDDLSGRSREQLDEHHLTWCEQNRFIAMLKRTLERFQYCARKIHVFEPNESRAFWRRADVFFYIRQEDVRSNRIALRAISSHLKLPGLN